MAKMQPVPLVLKFDIDIAAVGTNYIDLAQACSAVSRKLHRQGQVWMVAGFTVITAGTGLISISQIPYNYCVSNAWHKAYAQWQLQQRDVIKASPSLKAKWRDFKVYSTPQHVNLTQNLNLMPTDISNNAVSPGEWFPISVAVPLLGGSGGSAVTSEVTLHVIGDNIPPGAFAAATTTSVSLVDAYAQSRAIIQNPDPDVPSGANLSFYNELADSDELSEQVLNNVANENDNPPYDPDDYPGTVNNMPDMQMVDFVGVPASTTVNKYRMNGGAFPCGIIKIVDDIVDDSVKLFVHLVPGRSSGYFATPMQDM